MQHRRPGDAIITTRLGWPAVWWYGGSRPPQEDGIGSRLTDGAMLYELTYRTPDDGCPAGTLSDLAARHDRALVYLGFQDVPTGFDRLAVSSFNTFGGITSASQFSDLGLAFVVDFRAPPPGQPLEPHRLNAGEAPTQRGCVAVQAARRW
jgi:hypothetical protein